MTYTWYPFSNLTPADSNSLQAWDYTTLVDGDKAVGMVDGIINVFEYDASSALTQDIPFVVTSDGNGGNGRWIRRLTSVIAEFFNGTMVQKFDALVTSDGATVTLSVTNQLGGDLQAHFSSGQHTISTPDTIALQAGSDTSPTENYVYYLESAPTTLVKSTTDWPATEHIKVAFCLVPSASYVQTYGCYANQNWNDGTDTGGQGHMSHIGEALRLTMDGSHWHEGVAGAGGDDWIDITTNGASPDNVYFQSTSGVCYQMHKHTVPAIDTSGSDTILVVNDSATPYDSIQDIAGKLLDNTGASMAGKYFNMVFWATANKTGEHSPLMMNLPGGSYTTLTNALRDADGYDVYTIPRAFKEESSTGFLIARVTFKHSAAAGGTWTVEGSTDLRGATPGSAAGGTGGGLVEFPDNIFRIQDEGDVTREIKFTLDTLTTGNTRDIVPADADMKILSAVNHDDLTDGNDTNLHQHDTLDAAGTPEATANAGYLEANNGFKLNGSGTFSSVVTSGIDADSTNGQMPTAQAVYIATTPNSPDREIYRELLEGSAFQKVTFDDCKDTSYGSVSGGGSFDNDGRKHILDSSQIWTTGSMDESTWSGTHLKAMLVADYTGSGTFELTADGGSNWETVTLETVHEFTATGTDLRARFTDGGAGNLVLYSYAIFYDIDDTVLSLQANTHIGGRRNLIINGDMRVAQRGTSFTGLTNGDHGDYLLDRWLFQEAAVTTGIITVTQDTDVPAGEGFANSLKIDCTTVEDLSDNDGSIRIGQHIEAQNLQHLKFGTSSARDLALSFWLKSDTKTGQLSVTCNQSDAARLFIKHILVADNNWKKYTIIVPGDTSGQIDNDADKGFTLSFVLACGDNEDVGTQDVWQATGPQAAPGADNFLDSISNNIWITGVQLEVGNSATDFEHISYGDSLHQCRRYYERQNESDSIHLGTAYVYSTTSLRWAYFYEVEKASVPAVVWSGETHSKHFRGTGSGVSTSTSSANKGKRSCRLVHTDTAAPFTVGEAHDMVLYDGSSTAWIEVDAEL
jgi:hypothetical protein